MAENINEQRDTKLLLLVADYRAIIQKHNSEREFAESAIEDCRAIILTTHQQITSLKSENELAQIQIAKHKQIVEFSKSAAVELTKLLSEVERDLQ